MTRSLLFATDPTGTLRVVSPGRTPLFEVLAVPGEYSDEEALAIACAVHAAGCLQGLPGAGRPVRITWRALIEKGIACGVLEEKEEQKPSS
jgi:hypothetical protein